MLKRLHPPPPPPAAATCPAQEHVPSPIAPCPAPRVGPGCATAASRRDGHLGQTELFIQFTSLKLQEPRAAPRPHQAVRGAAAGGSASARSAPRGPRAVPGRVGGTALRPRCQAGQSYQAGAQAGTRAHAHAPVAAACTAVCRRRCEDRVPRGCGGTAALPRGGVHAGIPRCAGMRACVSMRVQPCLAPPDMPRTSWGLGGGGCPCRRGSGPRGAARPTPPACMYMAVPSPCPSPDTGGGLCHHVPGVRGGGPPPSVMGGPCLESRRLLPVTSTTVSTATLKAYSCCLANEPALVAFPGGHRAPSPCSSPQPWTMAPSPPTHQPPTRLPQLASGLTRSPPPAPRPPKMQTPCTKWDGQS